MGSLWISIRGSHHQSIIYIYICIHYNRYIYIYTIIYIYIIVQWEILQPYFMVVEVCRFGFYWAISSWTFLADVTSSFIAGWWLVPTPLKNMSQLGL